MKEFVKIVSGGVLCEFLEVAFHLILYVREVYPAVVFERRKKYNVPVQVWCPIFCQLLRLRKIPLIATYHGKLFFICKSVMKGSVANIMALLYS